MLQKQADGRYDENSTHAPFPEEEENLSGKTVRVRAELWTPNAVSSTYQAGADSDNELMGSSAERTDSTAPHGSAPRLVKDRTVLY